MKQGRILTYGKKEKSCFNRKNGLLGCSYHQNQPPEVFLEVSQNSQKNICTRVSILTKLQASESLF